MSTYGTMYPLWGTDTVLPRPRQNLGKIHVSLEASIKLIANLRQNWITFKCNIPASKKDSSKWQVSVHRPCFLG